MPPNDVRLLETHVLTEDEVQNWLGDTSESDYRKYLTDIANGIYTVQEFRYDVISYNDLLTGHRIQITDDGHELFVTG